MSALWLNKMSLICVPFPNNNLASMDKSAFVGAMGSSIRYQGTWEESCPLMCWVIQTLVPAVNPARAVKLAPVLNMDWEHLENSLRQSLTNEKVFMEV